MRLSQILGSVFVVALTSSYTADAEAMKCGNKLASEGDTRYEVRSNCGEPDDAQQRVEYRTVRRRVLRPCEAGNPKRLCEEVIEETIQVVIDEWTYDFGRNRFIRYLTFEQGKLVQIETGSYGKKPSE